MRKRILSALLCLLMVLSLLPIQAFAEEGEECLGSCNHVHWGDAICDGCHLCSADCPKDGGGDCWYESHCKECGACYMSADNWCDECGWCQDCMQEAHCQDCGRCFVGEDKDELCEDCKRCASCADGVCADCNKCGECTGGVVCEDCNKCMDCGEADEHCQACLTHLLDDSPCGYCEECAEAEELHCEECHACFEGDAERCLVHEDELHCAECAGEYCEGCGECEVTKPGIVLCEYCGLCTDCCREISESEGCSTGDVCVKNSDWDDHFCRDCGVCFCDDNRCATCDLCKKCCKDKKICKECDCAETASIHNHKYDAAKWVIDQNNHWNECRVCHEKVNVAPHKDNDGDGYCDVCGVDQAHPLYISVQPKDLVKKVSDEDLPDNDPYAPENNRAKFSVAANDLAGRTLTYQWYWVLTERATGDKDGPVALVDNEADYINGATTSTLDIGVPIDGCKYAYEFFCEVTATAADGTSTTITSRYARLRTAHNYGPLAPTDKADDGVKAVLDDGTTYTCWPSPHHNETCIGRNCDRVRLSGANTEHTYVFSRYLGKGHLSTSTAKSLHFYLVECTGCGHEDLRYAASEEDIPHTITLDAPEGASASDESAEETVTSAKKGTEITLFSPTLNDQGHVFTGWEVIKGSVTLIPNHNHGIYKFVMPAENVELKALYDDSRHAVESIQIDTVKVNGEEVPVTNRTITVKVGDVIEATAALNPDTDIIDERVLWAVMDFGGGMEPRLSIDGAVGNVSDPTASPVTLKALKITGSSKLYLRATAYASKLGTDLKAVSDFIYVNIVAEDVHICDYEVKTVYPTCTLRGYDLYTCACGDSYKTRFTQSLGGHNDTDDDGLCDNINQNTGEVCGFKLSAGGSAGFVGREKIDAVKLTVAPPAQGAAAGEVSIAKASEDRYTVARTRWMTADGTELASGEAFAPGMVYTVSVTLEAGDGYAFQLKEFSSNKSLRPTAAVKATTFQLNTEAVTPDNGSSKETVNLSYTFTATEGEHSHDYGDVWKFDDTNHWKSCACGDKIETAAHTESERIIDTEAGIDKEGAWHTECETCGMQMSSGTIDALKKIDTAEVTVTAPMRGGKPETATTKDSAKARYSVAATDWDPVAKYRFAPGTEYTVKVTLEAKDGYAFQMDGLLGDGNTEFFINGKKATVVSGDAQQVIITYQFPATRRSSYGGSTGSGGTTTAQPVKSPGTGDAGIALYAAMGLLSLTGGAWVVGKKRKEK